MNQIQLYGGRWDGARISCGFLEGKSVGVVTPVLFRGPVNEETAKIDEAYWDSAGFPAPPIQYDISSTRGVWNPKRAS